MLTESPIIDFSFPEIISFSIDFFIPVDIIKYIGSTFCYKYVTDIWSESSLINLVDC